MKKIYLTIFLLFNSCNIFKNYPQDNIVEEWVEEIIEEETGIDIDISPFSPESTKNKVSFSLMQF